MFCHVQSQRRTHESPMDFEWQTHAPRDPKSPFPQSKPGHKVFESIQPVPSFLNQSPTPTPKFRTPSFTTPRKAFEPEVFSETSGIESSPGEQCGADDTPEKTVSENNIVNSMNTGTLRQPIFGKYSSNFTNSSSPSRVDQRRKKFGKTITQQMRKRKRLDLDYNSFGDSESESECDHSKSKSRRVKNPTSHILNMQPGLLASFFNYLESHPNLPSVLSFYAQLTVNMFIAGLMIFGMYTFWTTVRADVDKASEHERSLALAEISKCAQDFVINGCGSRNRAPVMEIPCNEFDLCMNRDPDSVGRARISAHTFAQIFNSFIEPISYKAMIFIVLIVSVTLLVNNLAFGLYRSKSHQHASFQYNSFPTSNPQEWMPHLPKQNLSHDFYAQQTYHSIGPSHISNEISNSQNTNLSSRSQERSRSPRKSDMDRGRSITRKDLEYLEG